MLAPVHRLVGAVVIGLAMAVLVTLLAHNQPWLGLRLVWSPKTQVAVVAEASGPGVAVPRGTEITGIGDGREGLRFATEDFTIEPASSLATFQAFHAFLDRQSKLARIQAADEVVLTDAHGKAWRIRPSDDRPLSTLPADFWIQVFVGVFAWLISACIWAFRPNETSARYLLLSGWSTLMFAPLAAVYSTRELALPGDLFRALNDSNFLGGSLFAASLAALLLYYPKRIAPRWAGWAIVGLFIVWWIAQEVDLFTSMALARRALVLAAVLATFVLAAVHWWLTRSDPIARASLQWFLMSWLIGVSAFVLLILAPPIFGIDTTAYQGYGFLLFLLVYGGLAFGIMRFRLFDLGEWWVHVVLWTVSLLALVVLDLLFVVGMQLSTGVSLGLALLICGLIWLPLRAWLWGRVFRPASISERALFQNVVGVALSPWGEAQAGKWREMLQEVFEPLRIEAADPAPAAAQLEQDGLALAIPTVEGVPGLRLEYASGGRRLFTRRDQHLASELAGMLRHTIESRTAYETGAAIERSRIAGDIHDNVGARLLSALHSPGGERKDGLIRETLADLRTIINDAARPGGSLDEALASLRRETAERLSACGLKLDWPIEEAGASEPGPTVVHAVRSIVREAVSNVIKHAGAKRVLVQVARDDEVVTLVIEDDGKGFDPEAVASGHGLNILQRRVAAQKGSLRWSRPKTGGARLDVSLPAAPPVQGV